MVLKLLASSPISSSLNHRNISVVIMARAHAGHRPGQDMQGPRDLALHPDRDRKPHCAGEYHRDEADKQYIDEPHAENRWYR